MKKLEHDQRLRRNTVIRSILILLGIGMLYAFFTRVTGWRIPCMVKAVTGLYCPGCGVTRMCLALLRLDFGLAFRCNPVIFCLLPVFAGVAAYLIIRYIRFGTWQTGRKMNVLLTVIVILLVGFGILRNLPGMEMLQPPAM